MFGGKTIREIAEEVAGLKRSLEELLAQAPGGGDRTIEIDFLKDEISYLERVLEIDPDAPGTA